MGTGVKVSAKRAGAIREVDIEQLTDADLAVVANPNNPDGRVFKRDQLLDLAEARGSRGLLVIDEAFMDVGPADASYVKRCAPL